MDKIRTVTIIIIAIAVISIGGYLFVSANTTNSKIEITSNDTLKNGDNVEFILKDEYRNPIPGESVDFKILDDSGKATKAVVVTDDSGHGSYTIQTLDNGNYTVHCNFNGTMFHKKTNSISNLNIDDGFSA